MSSEKKKESAALMRAYRKANPEYMQRERERTKKWRLKNATTLNAHKKKWRENAKPETKLKMKAYRRVWEKTNRIRKEAYRIRSKFKLATIDEAQRLVEHREAGTCECCGVTGVYRRLMHIDHCHVTGKIRAVLCNKCNTSLGLVNDNQDHLRKLIAYLEAHK